MQEIYQQSIDSEQIDTLTEIILKFPYFQELQHSLSIKQYRQVVSHLKYEILVRREPLELQSGYLYFFLQKGSICRRESTGRTQKNLKNRDKTWASTISKHTRTPQPKESPKMLINQYDSYEEHQVSSKYVQYLYCYYNSKNATVLYLNLNELRSPLQQKIKELQIFKLKFLCEVGEMKSIQRSIITEKLHCFQFLELKFSQIVYDRTLRQNLTFFIQKGLVQVINGRKRSGYVLSNKFQLGITKEEGQWARCASDKVQCYVIKTQDLLSYFPTFKERSFNQVNRLRAYMERTPTVESSVEDNIGLLTPQTEHSEHYEPQKEKKAVLTKKRIQNRSMQDLKMGEKKKSRQMALRQHFSNFYNEVFDQFSSKKTKQLGYPIDNQQNLNLYKIKLRQRKAPAMQELKARLKNIRIQKITACKQKLRRKVHISSLSGLGVTVIQQQF